ncbi:hypothetical protein ACFYU5_33445 [Nocardia aobensis]|uniref:Uncharacterized protein n=1 Tax=Nocardia aobensis TaxID=257277 RepID=A0ABW6PE13_9NOCA
MWNYTYRPDPRFHGTGPLYLGLELEIIVPEHRFDTCATLATDHLAGLGYLKRDLQSYLEDGAAPDQIVLTISHAFGTWALAPLRIR